MIKKIFKFIALVLVLLVLALLFLVQGSVKSSEQLKNLPKPNSIAEILDLSKANYNLTSDGLTTDLLLDSRQFSQLIKFSSQDDQGSEQNMAFTIEGDHLRIQSPVKLAFLDSKADIDAVPRVVENQLELEFKAVRLGNLPIPKSILINQLKTSLGDQDNVRLVGDRLRIDLPQTFFTVKQVEVKDSKLALQVSLSQNLLDSLNGLMNTN
ncbi:hypothetical protein [Streptococcus oricebi]|uniref:DUF2140 family protein n=1 Tax=Streptococcus oricebi TaxID=1547447 RepID=A0ABS5B395_9STRE|nr:hypothetical protein [Streptococcus oricebi]MBP2623308.1 hypothetical protein [Streptococcus oricebi]